MVMQANHSPTHSDKTEMEIHCAELFSCWPTSWPQHLNIHVLKDKDGHVNKLWNKLKVYAEQQRLVLAT